MKILGSTVVLSSKHSLDITDTGQESLRVWRDARNQAMPSFATAQLEPVQGDRLTISKEALQAFKSGAAPPAETSPISVDPEFFGLSPEDRVLIMILEKALGIRISTPDQLQKMAKGADRSLAAEMQRIAEAASKHAEALKQAATAPSREGWGYILERNQSHEESETLSFAAKGLVNTSDGRQISIDIQINMKREFMSRSSLTMRGGDAKVVDPLVINYDGPAADVKKTSFVFNLDAAGADPGFGSLRIWSRDDAGNDLLVALAQKGVGAIYVGNVSAQFSAKDETNTQSSN